MTIRASAREKAPREQFRASRHEPQARRSPPSTSCMDLFRALSPVKGRSPPEAACFQRALTGLKAQKTRLGKRSTASPADGTTKAARRSSVIWELSKLSP